MSPLPPSPLLHASCQQVHPTDHTLVLIQLTPHHRTWNPSPLTKQVKGVTAYELLIMKHQQDLKARGKTGTKTRK